MPLVRRCGPTIEDPQVPDANEFQHMAPGFVERRIRISHIALYGAGIFLAAAVLVRWRTDIDQWGATVMTGLGFVVVPISGAVAEMAAVPRPGHRWPLPWLTSRSGATRLPPKASP